MAEPAGVGEGRRAAVVGAGPAGFYAPTSCSRAASRSTCSTCCRRPSASCAPASRRTTRRSRASPASTTRPRASPASASSAASSSARTSHARICSRATTRCVYAVGHRATTTGSASPARTAPARTPRRASSPGTTATRTPPTTTFDLSAERAVVVGNGNVALDVARMLVLDPDELSPTDTADHALAAFAQSRSRRSSCSAAAGPRRRRSPTRSCASSASSRAPTPVVDPHELELDGHSRRWLETEADADGASATSSCCSEYAARDRRATPRTGSCCASSARRSRSSGRARTAR